MSQSTPPKTLWNRDFILLWQGTAVSVFGDVLYSIAIGFWVYHETGSTALMGVMSSISMFVAMFLNPISGAIIDRINRKTVIVSMDAIRGVLMIIIGAIALNGNLNIELVLLTAFVAAFCNVMFQPATSTVFVDLVPATELVRAQSLTQGTNSMINLVGKGISGVLLATFGIGTIIIVNGISFLVSALSEWFIRIPMSVKETLNEKIDIKLILSDVVDGAKESIRTKGLNVLIVCALAANFLGSGYSALMLPLALMKGMDVPQFGYFMGAGSLASVLAMLIMGLGKIKPRHRMPLFIVSFSLNMLFTTAALLGYGFIWLTSWFFLADFVMVLGNALLNSTMILAIPKDKRATILGFVSSFSIAGIALSMVTYGFLAEMINLSILALIGNGLSFFAILPLFVDKGIWKIMSGDNTESMPRSNNNER